MKYWIGLCITLTILQCPDKGVIMDVQDPAQLAKVIEVDVTGQANNYNFSVRISSPDTGCEQYADWWEVVSDQGELIYRRILAHSHVTEQPFTRSGGPVPIQADQRVWIRAHMNNTGYGNVIMVGTPATGFQSLTLEATFSRNLELVAPFPGKCDF